MHEFINNFGQELKEATHFKNDLKDEEKIMVKVSLVRGLTRMIAICILAAMCLIFTWYLIRNLYREKIEMFAMSVVITGVCFTAAGVFSALSISDEFQKARDAARHVCAIIEMKPSVDINEGRVVDSIQG